MRKRVSPSWIEISYKNRQREIKNSWDIRRKRLTANIFPRKIKLRSAGVISSPPIQPVSISCIKDLLSPSIPLRRKTIQIIPGNAFRKTRGCRSIEKWKTKKTRSANKSIISRETE